MTKLSCCMLFPCALFGIFALTLCAAAPVWAATPITLTGGAATGNPLDTVDLPVYLVSGSHAPSTLIFGLTFDASKLEFMGAQAGPATVNSGFSVTPAQVAEGQVQFSLSKFVFPLETLSDGNILLARFRLRAAATAGENHDISIVNASAAGPDATAPLGFISVPVTTEDGQITVGCDAPDAPANVQATDGLYPDRVRVTWTPAEAGLTHRVYRNMANNPNEAAPISGWLTETEFNDVTAAAPTAGSGCNGGTVTRYYYWVVSRNSCAESAFSQSDQGYRGSAKSMFAKPDVYEKALPATRSDDDFELRAAQPDSVLAIRLRADQAIDPSTVWGWVAAANVDSDAVVWQPAVPGLDGDGWVVFEPKTPWVPGDLITFTAGAATLDGAPLPETAVQFLVEPASPEKAIDALPQPDVDGDSGNAAIVPLDATLSPVLGTACGGLYSAGPDALFEQPARVWLPVPAGVPADELQPFYCMAQGGEMVWQPGSAVEGWLVPGSELLVEWDGTTYFGFEMRHGGVVQLGLSGEADNALAGVFPVPRDALGDILILAAVAFAVAMLGRSKSRAR